jgi:hypothetical protein
MVNWRAVIVGFLVEVVLGVVGVFAPGLGQLGAAILGGFAAGIIAKGGIGNGAWHGLLAGALGGLVIVAIFGLFGTALLGLGGGPGGVAFGLGLTSFLVVVWLLVSLPSAVGGAIGAAVA